MICESRAKTHDAVCANQICGSAGCSDAVTTADDEQLEHELGIDRTPAGLPVERLQLLAKVSQHAGYNRIDPAPEMARRTALFSIEQGE